jgi:hypothetical protein
VFRSGMHYDCAVPKQGNSFCFVFRFLLWGHVT